MPRETTSESKSFAAGLLADRDANELQGFASDIKEAVAMFEVNYCLSYPTSVLC